MTQKELKKKIKEKFGTISKFADDSGLPRYDLQKALMKVYKDHPEWSKFRDKAAKLCARIDPKEDDRVISPEKREALKRAIESVGGVSKFCDANEFNRGLVFGILSGVYNGKAIRDTPAVRDVFNHFEIKL